MERHQIRAMDYNNLGIRSRIKYQGSFKESLAKLVEDLEEAVEKEIMPNYGVDYTQFGDQITKIKVVDDNLMVDKLISIHLFHSKNDVTYGYVTPKFTSAIKSQKATKSELPKFGLGNNEEIVSAIIGKLKEIIEEF